MPRFNLRTIFWLFLVVALCVGWRQDHRRLVAENNDLKKQALTSALEDWREVNAFHQQGHVSSEEEAKARALVFQRKRELEQAIER